MGLGIRREHKYLTNISPDDISDRLRKIIYGKSTMPKRRGFFTSETHLPYYGELTDSTFHFYNNPSLTRKSKIEITGDITLTDNSPLRRVSIEFKSINMTGDFVLACLVFVVSVGGIVHQTNLESVIVSVVLTTSFFGLAYAYFLYNYYETKRTLEDILELRAENENENTGHNSVLVSGGVTRP